MALPDFSMRQLLEAGVHFGHQTHRWNPRMKSYIYGSRSGIHIIDLAQTVPLLHQALVTIRDAVAKGGRVLYVGTKRQASDPIKDAAKRSAQYYINSRWLGGIKDMGGTPDIMFVIDTNKEQLAIKEANRLGIPVVAILDSNSDPTGVTHPIPGNDDAGRAISLYCDLVARAAIEGISVSQSSMGVDIGAAETPQPEILPVIEQGSGASDDLSSISGIGVTLKKKLAAEGVTQVKQVAEWSPEQIAAIDDKLKLKGRIAREEWVEQAKQILAGAAARLSA